MADEVTRLEVVPLHATHNDPLLGKRQVANPSGIQQKVFDFVLGLGGTREVADHGEAWCVVAMTFLGAWSV